jgi:RNA polymerase sigma-70 factor (ECF subfamily)
MDSTRGRQNELYLQAVAEFGSALVRLVRVYEADAERQRDLLQDVHFALWRSFSGFAGDCSLRTWVYRVAHNVAISSRLRRRQIPTVSLKEVMETPAPADVECEASDDLALERLRALIRRLKPPDDQVMLLYLEDASAETIGEVTGLSPRAVATRIHRLKSLLAKQFHDRPLS